VFSVSSSSSMVELMLRVREDLYVDWSIVYHKIHVYSFPEREREKKSSPTKINIIHLLTMLTHSQKQIQLSSSPFSFFHGWEKE